MLDASKQIIANPPIDDIERFTAVQDLEVGDYWYLLNQPYLDTFICEHVDNARILIKRVTHRNVSEDC